MAFLLGLAALFGCAYFTRDTLHFKHDGLVAAGVVVDERGQHEISVGGRGVNYSSTYSPVVEFTPDGGKAMRIKTHTWSSWHERLGSSVQVLYFNTDPSGAHLDRFFDNWGFPLILGVIGIFLILGALGVVDASGSGDDDDRRQFSFRWFD
jgi:hypothetical protein